MDQVTGFEIPAGDTKRAKKFYEKVFGWKVDLWGDEYSHVKTVAMDKNWVPKKKGAVNGGMFKRTKKTDKPLLVITVRSVDATLKKAKAAGGRSSLRKQRLMSGAGGRNCRTGKGIFLSCGRTNKPHPLLMC
jgi:uncharacterized protein